MPFLRRAAWVLWAVLGLAAFAPSTLGAQDTPDVSCESGQEAFHASRFEEALEFLNRCYEQTPSDRVRFNIGRALQRLLRFAEAEEVMASVLDSPDFSDEERTRVVQILSEIRANLGEALIVGADADQEVVIDGAAPCPLPCSMTLNVGPHRAEIDARVQEFTVQQGERTVVRFEPPGGPVRRVVDPPTSRLQPGLLSVVGGVALLSGAGMYVGFGLRSNSLLDEFEAERARAMPDLALLTELKSDGETATLLANIGIGIAVAGLVAIVVDLLLEKDDPPPADALK